MKTFIIKDNILEEREIKNQELSKLINQSTKDQFERLEFQQQYLNRQDNIHKHAMMLMGR